MEPIFEEIIVTLPFSAILAKKVLVNKTTPLTLTSKVSSKKVIYKVF